MNDRDIFNDGHGFRPFQKHDGNARVTGVNPVHRYGYEVVVIMVDGTIVRNKQDKEPDLKQLQKAVGGLIETVPHLEKFENMQGVAYCNEEGMINCLPLNIAATRVWLDNLGKGPFSYPPRIFGDMVFYAKVKL